MNTRQNDNFTYALTLCRFDAEHYRQIIDQGYRHTNLESTVVAFFPVYPAICRAVVLSTGLPTRWAMILVANVCLAGAVIVLVKLLRLRTISAPNNESQFRMYSLAAFLFFPTALFWRMGYTESTFILISLLILLGFQQRWKPLPLAVLIGLLTATRSVGIAFLLPLAWRLYQDLKAKQLSLWQIPILLLIGCWGLLAFMTFLYIRFNDPLLFITAQEDWRIGDPAAKPAKWFSLLTLYPVYSVFAPGSAGYWENLGPPANALLNYSFANPLYFLFALFCVVWGRYKKWISVEEFLVSLGLLAIPYFTRAHEMCMASHGRFAAVVVPMYFVIGHFLTRIPPIAAWIIILIMAILQGVYTANFVAGNAVF